MCINYILGHSAYMPLGYMLEEDSCIQTSRCYGNLTVTLRVTYVLTGEIIARYKPLGYSQKNCEFEWILRQSFLRNVNSGFALFFPFANLANLFLLILCQKQLYYKKNRDNGNAME